MRIIVVIMLCCAMLFGCAPAAQGDFQTMPEVTISAPSPEPKGDFDESLQSQEKFPTQTVKFPESCDPLEIFSKALLYGRDREKFLSESKVMYRNGKYYYLKYKPIPGLYEIYGTHIGGCDARTTIEVRDGKVCQVTTTTFMLEETNKIYEQMKDVLGEPDVIYTYDSYYQRVIADEFVSWPERFSIPTWDMGDYYIEISVFPAGNRQQMAHIAAFEGDPSDIRYYGYTEMGYCCPHDNDMSFDEDCIYYMEDLIGRDYKEVISKYKAEPSYASLSSGDYFGERQTDEYIIEDLTVLGCDADLEIIGYSSDMYISYVLDVTHMEIPEIQSLGKTICTEMESVFKEALIDFAPLNPHNGFLMDFNDASAVEKAFSDVWRQTIYGWKVNVGGTDIQFELISEHNDDSNWNLHPNTDYLILSCKVQS